MNCDICQRAHHPKRLPFFCVVDARNALYEGRLANASILMEADELESRVNKLLSDNEVSASAPTTDRSTRVYAENCASEEHKARECTERIMASADKLRDEVAAARREIQERRASIVRRKSELAAASQGVAARRNRELEEVKRSIKTTRYTWDREYEAMTQYRAALCMEVAKLYRLQRVKRGNPVRFEYKIGGIDIIDLHQLNSGLLFDVCVPTGLLADILTDAQPDIISASLAHITHLLWLTSHYLAIRLPAEITLPHNDYPRPTIFSLPSSYQHGDIPFPGTSPPPPEQLDRQFHHVPHPRPLFVDKSLPTLAKEDPSAYNAFTEAVCLLSYNIVWLCRTQGVTAGGDISTSNLEDFFSLGRNMYNLLMTSNLQRTPQHITDASGRNGDTAGGHDPAPLVKAAPRMGLYSHGTAHTFLGGATGNELTRSFKMPNPIKLADRLRARLAQENPARDWELIENDLNNAPGDALDDGVLVGGAAPKSRAGERGGRFSAMESYMSVNTVRGGGGGDVPRTPTRDSATPTKAREKEREKGTSGWMKIKPR
ncbi:hypothetical protein DL769_011120 [Monosporascus sp. CRB-8-3]|nr:hypothetical protein DL769_011120 [Monosporascus sp. CRB-8-3]